MGKKTSFEEFNLLGVEQEKAFLKLFLIGEILFFSFFSILMTLSEEIFKLGILALRENWSLVLMNFLLIFLISISLLRNFKIWLIKYLLLIFVLIIIAKWFYLGDPQYTKPLLAAFPALLIILTNFFYEIRILLFTILSIVFFWGLFLFYYSKIGALPSVYELYLICIFLFMMIGISFPLILRTKTIFNELSKTKSELEESKTVLEIRVAARTRELRELTEGLDLRVKERTKELQEKIEELERFQKLAVGRELKMTELKKEIKKLQKKLEEYDRKE